MSNKSKSTGVLSANTLVWTGRNYISSVIAGGDGTNIATVNIYDGLNTGGVKVMSFIVPAGTRQTIFVPASSVTVDVGLYVEVSGTGANATVMFGA